MRIKWLETAGVCLLMVILGLISTYPIINYFDEAIPFGSFHNEINWNRSGDHMQILYWFWLVKENILGHVPFDSNPFEFNMLVDHHRPGINVFPMSLVYALFSPLGIVAAYNCTILSTYVLTGLFMYLLVKQYGSSKTGALFAAVIFTLAPSRMNGLTGGNIYASLFFCFPWTVYFLEKGIRAKKIIYGVLSGCGVLMVSRMEPHLTYYLLLFLAAYLPFRFLLLLSESDVEIDWVGDTRKSWPIPLSLCITLGAGVAVVLYSQLFFVFRDGDAFIHHFTPWIFTLYPLLFLLFAICIAVLYGRLFLLELRSSLTIISTSLLSFAVLIPLGFLVAAGIVVPTKYLLLFFILSVGGINVFLLRKHCNALLCRVYDGFVIIIKRIIPVFPLLLACVYVVFWSVVSKTKTYSGTLAEGGRTLDDVRLYSAHLQDIFTSTANVFVGTFPILFVTGFVVVLLFMLIVKKRMIQIENGLYLLFFSLTALLTYLLALGLAFEKSSIYLLLYRYLPYFNYPRVSDRIVVLALFSMAIVSGLVIRELQRKWRTPLVISLLCVGAIVYQLKEYNIDRHPGITILDRGQDIYRYLKKNMHVGELLLELPLWRGDAHQSSLYQHYTMYDNLPRINGYSALVRKEYINTVFIPLFEMNRGAFNKKQFDLLHELGVRYITVHDNRDVFSEILSPFSPLTTVRRLANSPYLEKIVFENYMHFKYKRLRRDNLHLFRLKEKEEVDFNETPPFYYEMPFIHGHSSGLTHHIGEEIAIEGTDGKTFHAAAKKHEAGYLIRGPFAYFVPGTYRCYFSLKTGAVDSKKDDGVIATLEVARSVRRGAERVLATKDISSFVAADGYKYVSVDFTLDAFAKLEFRVFYHGRGELFVDKVSVYMSGQTETIYEMDAYKMAGNTGRLVKPADNPLRLVVEDIPEQEDTGKNEDIPQDLVFGPDRIAGKGDYAARFLVRKKECASEEKAAEGEAAVILSVTDGTNTRTYARKELTVAELDTFFSAHKLYFTLARDDELSFHVTTTFATAIQIDSISLHKLDTSSQ